MGKIPKSTHSLFHCTQEIDAPKMISSSQSSSPPQYQSYSRQYVTVGEVIGTESGFLRGHGTRAKEGKLQATVSGFVQRVNKLVSVSALNARYNGEIGDVVICRVLEVGDKRWKCDCNSRQNGVLLLSSVHLPGGVQRRRTEEDQRKMRQYFIEGDLISAEVQKIMNDGAISLHTRNLKYGKLHNGIFLSVPASLIKRCKQHFHHIAEIGLDLILGNNGYIWLQKTRRKQLVGKGFEAKQTEVLPKKKMKQSAHPDAVEGGGGGEGGEEGEDGPGSVSVRDREKMCRIRNSIVALSKMFVSIYLNTIMDVYNYSLELGLETRDIINPDLLQRVTQKAVARSRATGTASHDQASTVSDYMMED